MLRAASIMSRVSLPVIPPPSLGTIVSLAPSSRIWSSFSRAKASEVTTCSGCPFTAQTSASDTPVLPPVYSRSEEHTSELQSLLRISYAVFCLQQTKTHIYNHTTLNARKTHH